jgi:radical SAM protein with 4Fe4S-binding SPASM domain
MVVDEFRWENCKVKKHLVCAQIFKGLQVQADGEVVPCCVDWKRVNVVGDIKKEAFRDIWNGKKLRELQIKHLKGKKVETEPCKGCTMNDFCEYDNIDLAAKDCLARLGGKE